MSAWRESLELDREQQPGKSSDYKLQSLTRMALR